MSRHSYSMVYIVLILYMLIISYITSCKTEKTNRKIIIGTDVEEQNMDVHVRLNHVLQIRHDEEKSQIIINTDRSNELILDSSTQNKYILDFLHLALSNKSLIVIEFDSKSNRIYNLYYPITDTIFSIADLTDKDNKIQVHALKCPTLLALKKENPQFEKLYKILLEAYENRSVGYKVSLAVSVGNTEIMDVFLIRSP